MNASKLTDEMIDAMCLEAEARALVVDVMIVAKDGKLLRSGFLPASGKVILRWTRDHLEAATYTIAEARAVAAKIKAAGIRVSLVRDYGLSTEEMLDEV